MGIFDWLLGRKRGRTEDVPPSRPAEAPEPPLKTSPSIGQPSGQPIVVGIDFGTSGIKVALRDFADRERRPHVLDFGTGTEWLLPFQLSLQRGGGG